MWCNSGHATPQISAPTKPSYSTVREDVLGKRYLFPRTLMPLVNLKALLNRKGAGPKTVLGAVFWKVRVGETGAASAAASASA